MVSDSELLSTGLWSGMALLVATLTILGLGVMLQFDRLVGRKVAFAVVPAMGLGIAISSLLSGRDLKYAATNIEALALTGAQGGTSLLRLLTLALLAFCAATVVGKLFARQKGDVRPAGQLLFAFFMAYYVCNSLLNALFGTEPAFTHNTLYVPIAMAAVFVWRDQPLAPFLRTAKWALAAFMLVSLVAAVLKPELAVQPNYKGWIPGLNIRLWGVGSNPNSIGPLGLLLILLELMAPGRRWPMRWLAFALGAAVLLMAQSKTAWLAALVVAPLILWFRVGRAPTGGMRIGFALGLIAALLGASLVVVLADPGRIWDKLAVGQVGSDLSTLTGRLQIWNAAVRAWQENPVFGYGPAAWGPLHRATIGLPFAFSAHNQFLQSMSAAGTLGLITMVGYLGLLLVYCWRAAEATKGLSLAVFVMVFMRCLTEAPLSAATLFNGDVLTQVVLFRIALFGAQQVRASTTRPMPRYLRAAAP
jgi:O-antigen ligase